MQQEEQFPTQKDQPPVFKSWRQWYWLVLSILAAQIMLFYWLTQYFA
jgi:hypothetical protein